MDLYCSCGNYLKHVDSPNTSTVKMSPSFMRSDTCFEIIKCGRCGKEIKHYF